VDPQRLVQCSVERGAVITELLPQLLLLLGVDKVGGRLVNALLSRSKGPAQEDEASASCPRPPATMWPSHHLTSAPAWGSGAGMGRFTHWSHPGGGTSSSGISTAIAWRGRALAAPPRPPPTAPPWPRAPVAAPRPLLPAAGAERLSTADAAGDATTTGTAGCTSASGRDSVAAVACCTSTTAGARRASATAGCIAALDVTSRGLEASAAPRELSLAVAAALAPTRGALDERGRVGMDASALSTLAGARGGTETNCQIPAYRARHPLKDNSLPQGGEGALPLPRGPC
jgi:hypothetical protein